MDAEIFFYSQALKIFLKDVEEIEAKLKESGFEPSNPDSIFRVEEALFIRITERVLLGWSLDERRLILDKWKPRLFKCYRRVIRR